MGGVVGIRGSGPTRLHNQLHPLPTLLNTGCPLTPSSLNTGGPLTITSMSTDGPLTLTFMSTSGLLTPSSLSTGGLLHPHPRVQVACNITCIVEHRHLLRNTPSACCKRPLSIAQCVHVLECRWMHALILNTQVTRLSRLLHIGWTHTLTLECRLHQMENMLHTYTPLTLY